MCAFMSQAKLIPLCVPNEILWHYFPHTYWFHCSVTALRFPCSGIWSSALWYLGTSISEEHFSSFRDEYSYFIKLKWR
jgi:hypothetical protein